MWRGNNKIVEGSKVLVWGMYEEDKHHKTPTNYEISEPGCCDGFSGMREDVESVCPDCGSALDEDGVPLAGCGYSPECCSTCHYQGCDGSC